MAWPLVLQKLHLVVFDSPGFSTIVDALLIRILSGMLLGSYPSICRWRYVLWNWGKFL